MAILIDENLQNKTSRIEYLEDQDQEIIWIEIKQGTNKTYIGTYYGPQENAPPEAIEREISQLTTQIQKLKSQGRVILIGDFNAKISINQAQCKQESSRNGKYLEELISQTEMIPISINATRGIWTRQTDTIKMKNR